MGTAIEAALRQRRRRPKVRIRSALRGAAHPLRRPRDIGQHSRSWSDPTGSGWRGNCRSLCKSSMPSCAGASKCHTPLDASQSRLPTRQPGGHIASCSAACAAPALRASAAHHAASQHSHHDYHCRAGLCDAFHCFRTEQRNGCCRVPRRLE